VVSNSHGSVTSEQVELALSGGFKIVEEPVGQVLESPRAVTLSVSAEGENLNYQWYEGESGDISNPISGATSSVFETPVLSLDTQYWVRVYEINGLLLANGDSKDSSTAFVLLEEVPAVVVQDDPTLSNVVNVSIRSRVYSGDDSMLTNFVIKGPRESKKRILIRGLGPTLMDLDVPNAIEDPIMYLYQIDWEGTRIIGENDDWELGEDSELVTSYSRQFGAAPLIPGRGDSALLVDLHPGAYSVHTSAKSGIEGGVSLVEVYDVDKLDTGTSESNLMNVSTRGRVGDGENVIVAGFVVSGTQPKHFLIRAVGDEVEDYGVEGVLSDPKLILFRSVDEGNELVGESDNWVQTEELDHLSFIAGAFPLRENSTSAVMTVWLEPGVYTALVSSSNAESGVALVEVYHLSDEE